MLLDAEVPEAREALKRGSRVLVLALSQEKTSPSQATKAILYSGFGFA